MFNKLTKWCVDFKFQATLTFVQCCGVFVTSNFSVNLIPHHAEKGEYCCLEFDIDIGFIAGEMLEN